MNRRELLSGGATMMAAAAIPEPQAPSSSSSAAASPPSFPKDDIKLGVASYSLREFSRNLAIRHTLALRTPYLCVKEMHLPYRSTPEELAVARKQFARAGIILTGGSTVYIQKDDDTDIRSYFEYAKNAGMPMMVIGPTAATLPKIEKLVKEYNIKVAVHNHGPEDKHFPSPQTALAAMKDMDPRVGVCIDLGHTARTGLSPVEAIQMAGPRLLDLHIKDLANMMDAKSQVEVGDGAMPVPAIFRELKKMNYQGVVHLEYEIKADDPLPGMMKSFAYMRGVQAGLRST